MKRSRANVTTECLQKLVYGVSILLVTSLETYRVNFGLLFRGTKNFSTTHIAHTFCQSAAKFGNVGVWPIETYSPNFVNFGPGIP